MTVGTGGTTGLLGVEITVGTALLARAGLIGVGAAVRSIGGMADRVGVSRGCPPASCGFSSAGGRDDTGGGAVSAGRGGGTSSKETDRGGRGAELVEGREGVDWLVI